MIGKSDRGGVFVTWGVSRVFLSQGLWLTLFLVK